VLVVSVVVVLVSVVVEVVMAQSSVPGWPSWPAPPGDPLEHRGWGVATVVVVSRVVVSSVVVSSVVVSSVVVSSVVASSVVDSSVVVSRTQSLPCAPTSSHSSGVHGCARVHWVVGYSGCADAPLTYEAPITPSASNAPATATCNKRLRISLPHRSAALRPFGRARCPSRKAVIEEAVAAATRRK
jgi:hypothetical protein